MNGINKEAQLSARVAVLLQEPTPWEDMANTDYQWEISESWDTVRVQNFPTIEWNVISWDVQEEGWENIPVTDWSLGKSSITVNKVANINLKIKDIEKELSNLNIEKGLLFSLSQGNKRVRSRYIRDLAIAWAWSELGTSASKITVTDATVLKVVMDMGVKLDNLSVPADSRFLFAKPDLCALAVQSKAFDGTNITAEMRKAWYIGEFGWFKFIKDSTITDDLAVACDKNSVHFLKKLSGLKAVDWKYNGNAFATNLLGEMIFGGWVLSQNANRICKLNYEIA